MRPVPVVVTNRRYSHRVRAVAADYLFPGVTRQQVYNLIPLTDLSDQPRPFIHPVINHRSYHVGNLQGSHHYPFLPQGGVAQGRAAVINLQVAVTLSLFIADDFAVEQPSPVAEIQQPAAACPGFRSQ